MHSPVDDSFANIIIIIITTTTNTTTTTTITITNITTNHTAARFQPGGGKPTQPRPPATRAL